MPDDDVRYAENGDVRIAYEAFGDLSAGEPLLLVMGLDFQMVWWPDEPGRPVGTCGVRRRPVRQPRHRAVDALRPGAASEPVEGPARQGSADVHGTRHAGRRARGRGRRRLEQRARHGRVDGRGARAGPRDGGAAAGALADQRRGPAGRLGTVAHAAVHQTRGVPHAGRHPARPLGRRAGRGAGRHLPGHRLPGYPFPEAWAREAARTSHRRSPRDPSTTQRQARGRPRPRLPPPRGHHRADRGDRRPRRPADPLAGRARHGRAHPRGQVRAAPGHGPRRPARACSTTSSTRCDACRRRTGAEGVCAEFLAVRRPAGAR
nr:hypothetical protein [Angustibacter aerolatus]